MGKSLHRGAAGEVSFIRDQSQSPNLKEKDLNNKIIVVENLSKMSNYDVKFGSHIEE